LIIIAWVDVEGRDQMTYFGPGTGWQEQLGKLIGDTFAAFIVMSVIILVISQMLFKFVG